MRRACYPARLPVPTEPQPPPPDAGPSFARTLGLILLGGLALRAAFLLLEPSTFPVGDERTYLTWGTQYLPSARVGFSPFRMHLIFHPPLYPYFIAGFQSFRGGLAVVQWVQVVLSALLVPAVGRVGARAFGARTGLVAAGITAAFPELVWFAPHFWSETLMLCLLWWSFERLLESDATGRIFPVVLAGILLGLTALTRETVLYFAPLAALWLAWRPSRPAAGLRGAVFLAAAVLTVAPWTVRNWIQFRTFIPVSTSAGLNLWQGNVGQTREEVYDEYFSVDGRIDQYRYATRKGIEAILARQPWWIFEKFVAEMPHFWGDSQTLIHLRRRAYGERAPAFTWVVAAVVVVPYVAALGLFVVGLALTPLDRRRALIAGFVGYYVLLHVVAYGFPRYRLPILPAVFLFAAAGWVAWRAGTLLPGAGRRALALALAGGLAIALIPGYAENVAHPAFHGVTEQGGAGGAPP
jgi:4-amino-4-deoxy-L-arabinose transferase-like glycosyltransferase